MILLAFVILLILFCVVVLNFILKKNRGYGLYGKHYDEKYYRFEDIVSNIGIILMFLLLCYVILFHEPSKRQFIEAVNHLFKIN